MKKIFPLLILIVFLISGCKADQKTPIPVDPTSTTSLEATDLPPMPGDLGWGKIHGKITDTGTGEPIVGATVTCEHSSYTSPVTCSESVTTDAQGIYFFETAFFHDTDTIKFTVQAPGYQSQEITRPITFIYPAMEQNISLNPTP